MTGWGTRKCGEEGFLSTQADAFAGSEGKNKSPCFVRNDGVVAGALRNAERRDFSLRRPTLSQEAKAEEKVGLLRSK
jgi:hypothetical protein